MPDRDVLVIVNPLARGIRHNTADEIVRQLTAEGLRPELHLTTGPHEAASAAARGVERGFKRIAVAGGDGTVGEVAGALLDTGVAIGIIPLGTGNALGCELGLPLYDVRAACRIIAAGHTRDSDAGVCNGRPFAIMCGIGLDAEVAKRAHQGLSKRLLGRWGFALEFLVTVMAQEQRLFSVVADDKTIEERLWAVVVCNGSQYTWRLRFARGARLDDGLLDVLLFAQRGRAELLWEIARNGLSNGKCEPAGMRRLQARRVQVTADPPALWHADGEVRGATPVEIMIRPGALRITVPHG